MGVRLCWVSFYIVLFVQACKHSASVKYRYFYVVFIKRMLTKALKGSLDSIAAQLKVAV